MSSNSQQTVEPHIKISRWGSKVNVHTCGGEPGDELEKVPKVGKIDFGIIGFDQRRYNNIT